MKQQFTTTVFRAIGYSTLALLITLQVVVLPANPAYAAGQITNRKLELLAGDNNTTGVNGGSLAGKAVRHKFTFTVPTSANIGSMLIEYCTTAANVNVSDTCQGPSGLSATGASVESSTGFTNLSPSSPSANQIFVRRAATAQLLNTNDVVTITLKDVINPTTPNTTFFARISTFNSLTATVTDTPVDAGTVAASTTYGIDLSGTMPESLVFCTGDVIPLGAGSVPNCTDPAITNVIKYNQLFSPTDTATATSQMAASTNAGFGYSITVNGPTLTSGSNTIAPMGTVTNPVDVSQVGVSQFGLNLVANTTTATNPFGILLTPASDGLDLNGLVDTDYATAEEFRFIDGDVIATSASKGTNSQVYTVSYLANVPGSLPAGTYATTLTYICTPTY